MQNTTTLIEDYKSSTGQNVSADYLFNKFYDTSLSKEEHDKVVEELKYYISANNTNVYCDDKGIQHCKYGEYSISGNDIVKSALYDALDNYGTTIENGLSLTSPLGDKHLCVTTFCSPYYDVKLTLNKDQANYDTLNTFEDKNDINVGIVIEDASNSLTNTIVFFDAMSDIKKDIVENCILVPKGLPIYIQGDTTKGKCKFDITYLTKKNNKEITALDTIKKSANYANNISKMCASSAKEVLPSTAIPSDLDFYVLSYFADDGIGFYKVAANIPKNKLYIPYKAEIKTLGE